MKESYQYEVTIKCKERPDLTPVFSSVHNTPEQICEYNPRLFVAFNNKTERFEIHSLDDRTLIGGAVLPYKSLDARAIRWIKQNDIRRRGKEILRELDLADEKMKRDRAREFRNWVEDVGKETRSAFARSSLGLDDMKQFYQGGV